MVYTDLTRKAMEISCKAHEGQKDKGGFPYIHHPLYVAAGMQNEIEAAVALLHDVIEDSDFTAEQLLDAGIPWVVVEAVQTLTHQQDEKYMAYIERIRENPIACHVKAADLQHNIDLSRLQTVTEKDIQRINKYKIALKRLIE